MKFLTMVAVLILLLLNGCAQTAPKTTENATITAQPTDTTATEQTLLKQAQAFRKAHSDLFNDAGGVLVTELVPGGQGERIGLMPGDILLTYDGNPLQTRYHLILLAIKKDDQTSVTLTYLRGEAKCEAVLQGGETGIQIESLILSPSEQIDQIKEKGNEAYYQSRFQEALQLHQQALNLSRENGYKKDEADSLNNLGNVYGSLGQYLQALEKHEASLKIQQEISDRQGEAQSLNNLGTVYCSLGQYPQALEKHEASLKINQEIGDRQGEAQSLNNLGNMYGSLVQYPQALEKHEASLKIKREIGDRHGEASSLGNLGNDYYLLDQYPQAINSFQQAIAILMQLNVPDGQWQSWRGLSETLQKLGRTDAAILAGKRAVNVLQGMRSSNIALDQAQQKSFLENKTYVYHNLAGLLIEQGRLIEAEQVMAMLKEEEYFNYIRRDSREDNRTTRAEYTAAEKPIAAELDRFGADLVTLGRDWEELDKQAKTDEQAKTRLNEVEKQLSKAQEAFNGLLTQLENYFVERQGKDAVEFGERKLKELEKQQAMLQQHQAVIITTVTTQEKLYLLLTTPQVQLVRQSPIGAKKFNLLLEKLRNTLRHPKSDLAGLKQQAQALYAHLVKPLEHDLQQSGAKTLMWSLDGALRYIPMTVLHDGSQYLIEKYGMSLFTAASHSDWQEHAHESWRAAGLGVSHAIGEFSSLPSVPDELNSIIRQSEGSGNGVLPGEIHLNEAFSLDAFKSVIRARYPVLHLASHFKLRSDNDASELLLGDGSLLKMSEFKQSPAFKMQRVDLLTLSACDTASGGEGSGGEVESFAVLAQLRGAGGVLASLWRVEDASTAQLMRRFYQLRNENPDISKAEALRQAGSIHSNDHNYRHPFFWAPFVMMGNWL